MNLADIVEEHGPILASKNDFGTITLVAWDKTHNFYLFEQFDDGIEMIDHFDISSDIDFCNDYDFESAISIANNIIVDYMAANE